MNEPLQGPTDLWGDRPMPEPGETQRLEIGPLTIWIRRVENEVWLAHDQSGKDKAVLTAPPLGGRWSRWATDDDAQHLRITPVLPDRSIVVKPDHAFTLLRRASARVYMLIPAWVRVEAVGSRGRPKALLAEIPTIHLSDTWWGDFEDGALAFWLATPCLREITPDMFKPHMVISTLQMDNLSLDHLPVEKLSLHVDHLSIYQKDGWLWAEEVTVKYHGEHEGSEILMDDRPPREAEGGIELTAARTQTRSFRARTFARLRALSGWRA